MAPTSSILRAARPAFRQTLYYSTASARPALQNNLRFRTQHFRDAARRFQSTTSAAPQPAPSLFKRLWDSPVGLKTVHFWAPIMKVRGTTLPPLQPAGPVMTCRLGNR